MYIIVLEDAKLKSFHSVEKDTFCTSIQELPTADVGGVFLSSEGKKKNWVCQNMVMLLPSI